MKRVCVLLAACATVAAANAQKTTIQSSKLTDNWFIGINGGVNAKTTGVAVFKNLNPQAGLRIGRYLTPVYGLAASGVATFDNAPASPETNMFVKSTNVTLENLFNLNNLFTGYNGRPDAFEVVAVAGFGWGKDLYKDPKNRKYPVAEGLDVNYITSKFGLQLNFNLGAKRAWQFNIEPSINYNLTSGSPKGEDKQPYMDIRKSYLSVMGGFTYKFKNSNGTHNFTLAQLRDQSEIDGLNARINDLRGQVNSKDNQISADQRTINDLKKQLADCLSRGPKTNTQTIVHSKNALESVVTFRQGRSTIDNSQLPNVERIATYMNNHKSSRVVIKGYASPEGSKEINERLANQRADAVKNMLIKKYRINSSRISAEGNGIGDMFSEPDWNRVSICTINESN